VSARPPLSPQQAGLMENLQRDFVPPEARATDPGLERIIRDITQSDEVTHPSGQQPKRATPGETVGRWAGRAESGMMGLAGINPAEGGDVIDAPPATQEELAATVEPDAGGLGWGSDLRKRFDDRIGTGSWFGSPSLANARENLGVVGGLGRDFVRETFVPETWNIGRLKYPNPLKDVPEVYDWALGAGDDAAAEAAPIETAAPGTTTGAAAGTDNPGNMRASRTGDPAGLADDAEAAEEELNWINRQMRDRFGMDKSERGRAAQALIRAGTAWAQSPGSVFEGFNAGAGAGLEAWQGLEAQEYQRAQDVLDRDVKDRTLAAQERLRERADMSKFDQVKEMAGELLATGQYTPEEAIQMAERYYGIKNEAAWKSVDSNWGPVGEAAGG
jgi:hypothetical protein